MQGNYNARGTPMKTATQRQMQHAFVARGLNSRDLAHQAGRYVPAAAVLDELAAQLRQAKQRKR